MSINRRNDMTNTYGFTLVPADHFIKTAPSQELINEGLAAQGLTRDDLEEVCNEMYYNLEMDLEVLNELLVETEIRHLFDAVLIFDQRWYEDATGKVIPPSSVLMAMVPDPTYGPVLSMTSDKLLKQRGVVKNYLAHEAIHMEQTQVGLLKTVGTDTVWGTSEFIRAAGDFREVCAKAQRLMFEGKHQEASTYQLKEELKWPWEAEAYYAMLKDPESDDPMVELIVTAYESFHREGHYRYRVSLPEERQISNIRKRLLGNDG